MHPDDSLQLQYCDPKAEQNIVRFHSESYLALLADILFFGFARCWSKPTPMIKLACSLLNLAFADFDFGLSLLMYDALEFFWNLPHKF